MACGLAGAALNAATLLVPPGPQALGLLVLLRALTGLMLAGTYPMSMKIVALWFPRGVGPALGSLVGALVLGTAAPHLLRALGAAGPWAEVLLSVSALAAGGALLVALAVPEPPGPCSPPGRPARSATCGGSCGRSRGCAPPCRAAPVTWGSSNPCGCWPRCCWPRGCRARPCRRPPSA